MTAEDSRQELYEKLSTLLDAGVGPIEALEALRLDPALAALAAPLSEARSRMLEGEGLLGALAACPELLPARWSPELGALSGQSPASLARALSARAATPAPPPLHDTVQPGRPARARSGDPGVGRRMLLEAIAARASDIHFSALPRGGRVRLRVDGVLVPHGSLDREGYEDLLASVLCAFGLDTEDLGLSTQGTLRLETEGGQVELRLASVAQHVGPGLAVHVLRLDTDLDRIRLDVFVEDEDLRRAMRSLIGVSHGLVVVSGPSGCGKTTTLHSFLLEQDRDRGKVVSIEDPIAYTLPGVDQIPIDPSRGFLYAPALRQALRLDPDVLMVSEVRDLETAELLVKTALTGHLAFTCLHAPDGLSALRRMVAIGLDPYLLSEALRGVVSQRLLRRLCLECRRPSADWPADPDLAEELRALGASSPPFEAAGCEHCAGTGYRGRMPIFEVLPIQGALAQRLARGQLGPELEDLARGSGLVDLRARALERVAQGRASLLDALRLTPGRPSPCRGSTAPLQ